MVRPRILFFTTFYPPYAFGGDGISVQRTAMALAARGADVTVIHDKDAYLSLADKQPDEPEVTSTDGLEVVGLKSRLGIVSSLIAQQTGQALVHRRQLRSLMTRLRPDVIWHNNVSLMGAPGILGLEAPLRVYEAHEHWLVCPTHVLWRHRREPCEARQCLRCVVAHRRPPQLWRYTGSLGRHLDKMDVIIAKSEFSRKKHMEFGLRHKMEVVPLFLAPPGPHEKIRDEKRRNRLHPRPFFLYVGRLERIKGVQDLLPAIIRHGRADLLIAGDGDYAGELRRLAAGNPRVKFLGRLPPDQLEEYYAAALASLVPSICYETFGAILIESFRLGTPVIARRRGPFPEIVAQSGAGRLFDDQEELVEALEFFQDNPRERDRFSKAARESFDAFWQEDRVLARYGKLLAAAARRKSNEGLAASLEGVFGTSG